LDIFWDKDEGIDLNIFLFSEVQMYDFLYQKFIVVYKDDTMYGKII